MQKLLITILLKLLQNVKGEQKTRVIEALLDKSTMLPMRKMIVTDPNGVQVNGKYLDYEQAISFRESTRVLKDNFARKAINEQLKFHAIQMGVHEGLNTEMIMFSKSILWILQEENKLIEELAQE